MLRPGSIAVVGASPRRGSVGDQTLRQLLAGGYEGDVFPINPSHEAIAGLDCLPEIGAIGRPVDHAVLAVGNTLLESETAKAIEAGARSLTIFASCHGDASDGSPLKTRIATMAEDAGVPICGGNGMGFLNVEDRVRVCGFHQPPVLDPGGVTFLSHSGSLFSAMLHNRRGIGFNLVVSSGLELTTPMSAYMDWALDLASTRVIALFLETIRDPAGFTEALRRAGEAGVPVVALKIGASDRARAAVATHSEAIAGDDAVYEALFRRHGVHRVRSMDEMADTVELLSTVRATRAGGLGAVHDSGGERALLIDTAERVGVPLPDLGERTVTRLEGLLDPGLEPANPVDAWGTGRDATQVFVGCIEALAADPAIAVVAFSVDLTAEESLEDAYSAAALAAAEDSPVPVVVLANLATTIDPAQATHLREGGVPVLEGTETGIRAIGHLLRGAEQIATGPPPPRITSPITGDDGIDGLLVGYGLDVARTLVATNETEVTEAAETIGFPVVLKTAGADHKTDVGGVALGLGDVESLRSAYAEMAGRLGPAMTVSEQVPPGVEIGLGMITDPQFGPVVLISAGGTLIEVLRDRAALLPPVDIGEAGKAVEGLVVRALLDGARGRDRADKAKLAETIARFSELVADHAERFESIDLNPVIVGPDRAVIVDVLARERPWVS